MIRAHSIAVHVCEHGTLTLSLLDEAGTVVAEASMPAETAVELLDDASEKLEAFIFGRLADKCAGHA